MSTPDRSHDLRAAAIERRHARVDHATFVRRRIAVGVALVVVVVAAVLLVTLVWPGTARHDPTPGPATTVTVTQAPPQPTGSPATLPASATALLRALPGTVGPWVRTSAAAADVDGATEAWDVAYAGAGARLTVRAAQFPQAADAAAAFAAASKGGRPGGDVTVGGKKAGSYAVVPAPDGRTRVVWRNGTVVLTATGPDGVVQQLAGAYPM